jgi:hypothetical protein
MGSPIAGRHNCATGMRGQLGRCAQANPNGNPSIAINVKNVAIKMGTAGCTGGTPMETTIIQNPGRAR